MKLSLAFCLLAGSAFAQDTLLVPHDTSARGTEVDGIGFRRLSVAFPVMKKYATQRSVQIPRIAVIARNLMSGTEPNYYNDYPYTTLSGSFTFYY
ncbi:MAG TPA: hypothetical protein VFE50_20750 [Cyclobacteriaceae bacterium]|nr:hypothetical protein [Cyclobacteriaceae bacterium]